MNDTTLPSAFTPAQPPKTSGLAIAAFVMGLTCFCGLWPILALPAVICGIIALVNISRSNGLLKGQWMAITGIVVPVVMLPIMMAILMPALSKVKMTAQRIVCANNLQSLGTTMIVYAHDYDQTLPPGDIWCDVLIKETDVSPKSFICPSDDAVEGQSSYAINRSAAGKRLNDLPADMVLVFEVSAGPRRWNRSGGPESITADHHRGEGCNVVFVDGHTEFVSPDQLHTLRWTPD